MRRLLLALPLLLGCGPLSPAGAAAIEVADALACIGLALVPGPGAALSAVCTAEEPAVKAAVEGAVKDGAGPVSSPASSPLVTVAPATLDRPTAGAGVPAASSASRVGQGASELPAPGQPTAPLPSSQPLLHTATPALAAPSPSSLPPPRPGELASAYCARATGGRPLFAGRGRERRHVGCAPAGRVVEVQRGIDAAGGR